EGNMDAVTCHQFGITNAVASLGTALTPEQVLVLKRFAGKAVLVYDADAAGQAAMERAMTLFEEADLPVRVVVLPSGDPDAFLRAEGHTGEKSFPRPATGGSDPRPGQGPGGAAAGSPDGARARPAEGGGRGAFAG